MFYGNLRGRRQAFVHRLPRRVHLQVLLWCALYAARDIDALPIVLLSCLYS